jgi:alkylation response protein AidB-like acyl-CoA dehydrogenase
MEFRFTPEDEAFRAEVRQFLQQELSDVALDGLSIGMEGAGADHRSAEFVRDFRKKLAARRWLALPWPEEVGGYGASYMQQLIYNEEMAYHRAPEVVNMGVAWVGPSLLLYGTDAQKQQFLPRIASGDDIWCTFYSEPGAGSDLASLQTRAVLDGDSWVINGQKIWTSGAHRADWGWLAARTDPDAPKHRGISLFLVPMKSEGLQVQPLINMADDHSFNQVYFDNLRIPKENLVGEQNRGWYQLAVALDFERSSIMGAARAQRDLEDLVAAAREHRLAISPALRHRLAEMRIEVEIARGLSYTVVSLQSRGKVPNYEASMAKNFGAELGQRLHQIGMEVFGMLGQLVPGSARAPLGGSVAKEYLSAVSATIGGGTSEINRNVIATRGLGLPRG